MRKTYAQDHAQVWNLEHGAEIYSYSCFSGIVCDDEELNECKKWNSEEKMIVINVFFLLFNELYQFDV